MAHTVAVQTTAAAPLSQLKITTTTRPDQVQSFNPVRRDCGCPAGAFAYPAAASLTTPHHTVKLQFSLIHHIIPSLILFSLKLIADHFILLLSLYHFITLTTASDCEWSHTWSPTSKQLLQKQKYHMFVPRCLNYFWLYYNFRPLFSLVWL